MTYENVKAHLFLYFFIESNHCILLYFILYELENRI